MDLQDEMNLMDYALNASEPYWIDGEVTDDLDQILALAKDPLLNHILNTWFVETEGMSRKEKEAKAKERILGAFKQNRIYLTEGQILTMMHCILKKDISERDLLVVVDFLIPRGWAFLFLTEEPKLVPVIPYPVAEMFAQLIDDKDERYNLLFVQYVRMMLQSCLNLFGVIEKDRIRDFVIQSFSDASESDTSKTLMPKEKMQDLPQSVEEILDGILEDESAGWCDRNYVIHNDLKNRMKYRNILRQTKDLAYDLPDGNLIDIYRDCMTDVSDPSYKSMEKAIKALTGDLHDAEFLLDYITMCVVEDNADLARVVEILRNSGIACPSKRTDGFVKSCGEWLYTVKRWCYRGRSAREMGKAKIGVSHSYLSGGSGAGAPFA